MKKFTLILAAATLALSSQAATRNLFSQDYEGSATPEQLGWSYGGESMTIINDGFSNLLEFYQAQQNGRTANLTWGSQIFTDAEGNSVLENGVYDISFDFSYAALSNNQYNSAITVFTNRAPVTNQPYCNPWSPAAQPENYLFDITQIANDDKNPSVYGCNGDSINTVNLSAGAWYNVTLHVDVNARTVDYTMINTSDNNMVMFEGQRIVPEEYDGEPVSMYAEGLHIMVARYQTRLQLDNLKVSFESASDYANPPTVALTRLGKTGGDDPEEKLNMRAYTISFVEGEVLNLEFNGNSLGEIDWYDTEDGSYEFETEVSGTLKAWTTCGTATSEVVTTEIDCTPYVLPQAVATISGVVEGYNKTYTLTVDNSNVTMLPSIFISYKYVGANGAVTEGENLTSGTKIDVEGKGTLTLTTQAFGYAPATAEVENDKEFGIKFVADFARATADQITGYGFTAGEDLWSAATSGENNWTARKRLYYYDVATATEDPETGETVYAAVYPFGYVEDNPEAVIHRFYMDPVDDVVPNPAFMPNVTFWNNLTIEWHQNIGVTNNATTNNYNPVTINNLDENDFVMVNTINDYGSNSCHPVCATAEEYYAQLEGANTVISVAGVDPDAVYSRSSNAVSKTYDEENQTWNVIFPLYRIDTVVTKITAFYDKNAAGIADVIAEPAQNNDPYYYSIDGLRTLEPAQTGIYIHQGKKVYIRK